MNDYGVDGMKRRIYRRIALRTAIFAVWIAGLLFVGLGDEGELAHGTYFYMAFAVLGVWIVYLIKDCHFLKNEDLLRKQAIERNDERNVLITYKATRMAVVMMLCTLPVAICVLSLNGMQAEIDILAMVAALFALLYLFFWMYLSKTN